MVDESWKSSKSNENEDSNKKRDGFDDGEGDGVKDIDMDMEFINNGIEILEPDVELELSLADRIEGVT